MELPGETIGHKISSCFLRGGGGLVPVFLTKSTAIFCDFSEEGGGVPNIASSFDLHVILSMNE